MLRAWLGGAGPACSTLSPEENASVADLLDISETVFGNEIGAAEKRILAGDDAFHQLGQGLMILLKTSLEIDGELAKNAATSLSDAEKLSRAELQRFGSSHRQDSDSIWPPGAPYSLCQAQAQLAAAVVAVNDQSMKEYIRGLYKVRQSFMTLKSLADHDRQRVRNEKLRLTRASISDKPFQHDRSPNGSVGESKGPVNGSDRKDAGSPPTEEVPIPSDAASAVAQPGFRLPPPTAESSSNKVLLHSPNEREAYQLHDIQTPDMKLLSDIFVYTGTNLCFGLLLVCIGMVPSSFQYVLRIIGFQGNKERGLALMWENTKFKNVNGGISALILLAIYNAVRSACDILDDHSYPARRCEELVAEMRRRYPKSPLWTLEEARLAAIKNDLRLGIEILERPLENAPPQLKSLNLGELAMYQIFSHDHDGCTRNWLEYTKYTQYSHALYYYHAGCAQLELYRAMKNTDPAQAQVHKDAVLKYFHHAMHGVDRKKLMATELPFDNFVTRKIKKWTKRAEEWGIDLVDAVGVSPSEEMIYYLGGHKFLQESQLEKSLAILSWSERSPRWNEEDTDEVCIQSLLKGVVYRCLGDLSETRRHLDRVLKEDPKSFKGELKDNWVLPSAHYEMAIIAWTEKSLPLYDEAEKLADCTRSLNTVSRWGSYELDARLTLKVKTAEDVISKYKTKT